MRVLFVSTAGAGHLTPLLSLVEASREAGHEVLVVVPPSAVTTVSERGFPVLVGAEPDPVEAREAWSRVNALPLAEAAPFITRRIFCRLNSGAMLPSVRAAVAEWRPDLVIRDFMECGSAIAAAEAGIPQVTLAVTQSAAEAGFLTLAAGELDLMRPGIAQVIAASPRLTRFPESVDPTPNSLTTRYRLTSTGRGVLPDWWTWASDPLVYITFGTEAPRNPELLGAFHASIAAVADLPVRALVTAGRHLDPSVLGTLPDNVRLEPWVDHSAVLSHASVVVSHGGSGTFLDALAAGVPQVALPLFADQIDNARALARRGAGISLASAANELQPRRIVTQADVPAITEAIEAVIRDHRYRLTAAEVAAEMAELPPLTEALQQVLGQVSKAACLGTAVQAGRSWLQ